MKILLLSLLVGVGVWKFMPDKPSHSSHPTPPSQKIFSGMPKTFMALNGPATWPPQTNMPFPDFEMEDNHGEKMKFSDLKGKIIIVEPIGMTCPGCHAFAGASKTKLFEGVVPQVGLDSFETYLSRIGNVDFKNEDIFFVQLLLYSSKMGPTTMEDATKWSHHFNVKGSRQVVIAAGGQFINQASHDMIPGFFLLDKTHKVLSNSTGHKPADSLYEHLIPLVSKILSTEKSAAISVNEAYALIPHHQTTFDAAQSGLNEEDKNYYHHFFSLIDQAVVARVSYFALLRQGKKITDNFIVYDNIISELDKLKSEKYQDQLQDVLNAIKEQKEYFVEWNASGNEYKHKLSIDPEVSPLVRSSSQKLHAAYGKLMSAHPTEGKHNKQAFFDHLCALDFI